MAFRAFLQARGDPTLARLALLAVQVRYLSRQRTSTQEHGFKKHGFTEMRGAGGSCVRCSKPSPQYQGWLWCRLHTGLCLWS